MPPDCSRIAQRLPNRDLDSLLARGVPSVQVVGHEYRVAFGTDRERGRLSWIEMWIHRFGVDIDRFRGEFEPGDIGRTAFEFVENGLRNEHFTSQFEQRQDIRLGKMYRRTRVGNDQSAHQEYSGLKSPLHVLFDRVSGGFDLLDDVDTELFDCLLTSDLVGEIPVDNHVPVQRLDTCLDSLLDNR